MATPLTQSPSETEVVRYGFPLLPEFSMYCASSRRSSALRVANQNKGRKLYSWHLFSADGRPVKGRQRHGSPGRGGRRRRALVSDGLRLRRQPSDALLQQARAELAAPPGSAMAAVLGAIDTGVFALAEAGLLEGYRVTSALGSDGHVPRLSIRTSPSASSSMSSTATASPAPAASRTLDLMCHLIARRHGPGLAQIVANGFVSQRIRRDAEPQRLSAQHISGDSRSPFTRIPHEMEENLETPLTARKLAQRAGTLRARPGAGFCAIASASPRCATISQVRLQGRPQCARSTVTSPSRTSRPPAASPAPRSSRVASAPISACRRASFASQFTREQLRRFRPELDQQLVA